jgi:hypothetical protein
LSPEDASGLALGLRSPSVARPSSERAPETHPSAGIKNGRSSAGARTEALGSSEARDMMNRGGLDVSESQPSQTEKFMLYNFHTFQLNASLALFASEYSVAFTSILKYLSI